MIEVWLVDLAQSAASLEAVEAARPRLSREDIAHMARLSSSERQRERRLTTIALRLLIARHAGNGRYDGAEFQRNPTGKPLLGQSSLAFSVAHSGGRALIAVGETASLGVDIEALRDLKMPDARREKLIAAGDAVRLGTPSAAARSVGGVTTERALQAWVRIEALAKAEASGAARVLTRLGVIGGGVISGGGSADTAATAATDGPVASDSIAVFDLLLPEGDGGLPWFGALAVAGRDLAGPPPVQILPSGVARLGAVSAGLDSAG